MASLYQFTSIGGVGNGYLYPKVTMKEELFESLVFQWPYLFEKSGLDHIEVSDGWYTIIENLLECICYPVEAAKGRLRSEQEQYAVDASSINSMRVSEAEDALKIAMGGLPIFRQIKEKFGGLRIYADNVEPQFHHYMAFAESMALKTCEHCGAPGKKRDGPARMATYCNGCFKLADGVARTIGGMPASDLEKVAPNYIEY